MPVSGGRLIPGWLARRFAVPDFPRATGQANPDGSLGAPMIVFPIPRAISFTMPQVSFPARPSMDRLRVRHGAGPCDSLLLLQTESRTGMTVADT
jgi:hypothetical protein